MQGEISGIHYSKGYGFIRGSDNEEQDTFFHISGLYEGLDIRSLKVGDKVEFEITEGKRGPKAINLKVAF